MRATTVGEEGAPRVEGGAAAACDGRERGWRHRSGKEEMRGAREGIPPVFLLPASQAIASLSKRVVRYGGRGGGGDGGGGGSGGGGMGKRRGWEETREREIFSSEKEGDISIVLFRRSEERRVGKECRN